MLVLFVFLAGTFKMRFNMFLPANMFYIESLVYLSKNTFLNLKFLERHLLFINNSLILGLSVYMKRRFLYFYFYRLNFLALVGVLIIIVVLFYSFSLFIKCNTENVKNLG